MSSHTQFICIVGILYDIPSIVQAIGQIRPKRQTEHSRVIFFVPERVQSRLHYAQINAANNFQGLVSNMILPSTKEESYKECMTLTSVHDWMFKDVGCRFVNLSKRLGYTQNKCNLCDACTENGTTRTASIQLQAIENNRK